MRRLMAGLALGVSMHAGAHTIDVFTTHAVGHGPLLVGHNTVRVDDVDDLTLLNRALTQELQGEEGFDNAQSIPVAKTFLFDHHRAFEQASLAITRAENWGVTAVPSIVIDGHYQVVGTTDSQEALRVYRTWRRYHPEAAS